jgi:hypothetical protein
MTERPFCRTSKSRCNARLDGLSQLYNLHANNHKAEKATGISTTALGKDRRIPRSKIDLSWSRVVRADVDAKRVIRPMTTHDGYIESTRH